MRVPSARRDLSGKRCRVLPFPAPPCFSAQVRSGGTEKQMTAASSDSRRPSFAGEFPLQAILGGFVFLSSLDGLRASPKHWLLLFEMSLCPLRNAHRPLVDVRCGFESHDSQRRRLGLRASPLEAGLPLSSGWLPWHTLSFHK